MMQVVPLTEDCKEEWDEVVHRSPEAWLYHTYDFQRLVIETWPLEPFSFLVRSSEGKTLGIFPLQMQTWLRGPFTFRAFGSGIWGTGGPALLPGLGNKHRRKILKLMFEHLRRLAEENDIDYVDILLPPLAPAYLPSLRPNVNPLLFYGCQDTSSATRLLSLERTEDEMWKSFETRCRTAIRRAEEENFRIERATNMADIEDYYEIHQETYRRTGVPPHPFRYFELTWQYMGTKGQANFFMVKDGDRLIAAQNIGAFKTGCIYWTGASRADVPTGLNNLIQWQAMRWAKEAGYKWHETGEAILYTEDPKLEGISRFKRGFGGEVYPFFKGRIVFHPYKLQTTDFVHETRRQIKTRLKRGMKVNRHES